jgi:hypothetical protein
VDEELRRWAGGRAPRLVARAEAEAVAALRDALVAAALGERAAAPPRPPAPQGDAIWAYGIVRAGDPLTADRTGVNGGHVELVEASGLAALVSRVPLADFGAEPLRRNLNDLGWLERVARAHEAVLERALSAGTVIPLRLCTIYDDLDSVRRMLDAEHERLAQVLDLLRGRQEYGVKLLVDRERIVEAARARSPEPPEGDVADRSAGGAYLLRRRAERQVRSLADSLAAELADQVHARLQDWAIDAVTRPAQNRELSGHEGEMLLNAAYLVDADRIDELRALVAELEEHHAALGARIEVTGPWPPYNFVPGEDPLA